MDGLCSSLSRLIARLWSVLASGCAAGGWGCQYVSRCCGGGGNQYEAIPLVDIEQRRATAEAASLPGRSSAADGGKVEGGDAAAGSAVRYYRSAHRGPPPASAGAQPAAAASAGSGSHAAGRVVVL